MDPMDLAGRIGARVAAGVRPGRTVDRVCAGDRISDLLTHASHTTLLVTNLSSALLVCVAAGRQQLRIADCELRIDGNPSITGGGFVVVQSAIRNPQSRPAAEPADTESA